MLTTTVVVAPFEASELKISRAKRHITELDGRISEFIARKTLGLVVEQGPKPGDKCLVVRLREQVPSDLSPIVGDAIHNLRAALDLLACELVRLNGASDKNVQFPFSNDGSNLKEMIKHHKVDRASSDVIELIRSLKPYSGGNNALRSIHDLDIIDKHRTLIPVFEMVEAAPFTNGHALFQNIRVAPIEDGVPIMPLPRDSGFEIGQEISGLLHLRFPRDTPLAGHEIVPTLHDLAELVTRIVEIFRAHCLGQQDGQPD